MSNLRRKHVVLLAGLILASCLAALYVCRHRLAGKGTFSIYIESWSRIAFDNPSIAEPRIYIPWITEQPCSKWHTKAQAEEVISKYSGRMPAGADIMLGKALHINERGFQAEIDEIQDWLVSCGMHYIVFRLALSRDIPPVVRVYIDGEVLVPRPTSASSGR